MKTARQATISMKKQYVMGQLGETQCGNKRTNSLKREKLVWCGSKARRRDKKMLKMQSPPTMCMKTRLKMTNCHCIAPTFSRRGSAVCAPIDGHRPEVLTENARLTAGIGAKQDSVVEPTLSPLVSRRVNCAVGGGIRGDKGSRPRFIRIPPCGRAWQAAAFPGS